MRTLNLGCGAEEEQRSVGRPGFLLTSAPVECSEGRRTMRCRRDERQLWLHVSRQELAQPDDGHPSIHDLTDQLRTQASAGAELTCSCTPATTVLSLQGIVHNQALA